MSHSLYKLYRSLKNRKEREENGLFIAETPKVIAELLAKGIKPFALFTIKEKKSYWEKIVGNTSVVHPVSEKILNSISILKTPNEICGIFHLPEIRPFEHQPITPVLDHISDPANLGIIIRSCHWFGIRHVLATPDSVDAFNPKTILASKGSIASVQVHYMPPEDIEKILNCPLYGTSAKGVPLSQINFSFPLAFVIGNESHGIQHFPKISQLISIPSLSTSPPDSLNAGVATSLLLYHFTLLSQNY